MFGSLQSHLKTYYWRYRVTTDIDVVLCGWSSRRRTCSIGEAVSSLSSSVAFLMRWASSSPSSSGMLRRRARKLLKIISVLRTSSLNQTIPQRDTVASVAYFRSCTSNMTRTCVTRASSASSSSSSSSDSIVRSAAPYVRRQAETLSVGKRQEFVVVQHRVQILHPLRIHVSVEDDPLTLLQLSTNVIDDPERAQTQSSHQCWGSYF